MENTEGIGMFQFIGNYCILNKKKLIFLQKKIWTWQSWHLQTICTMCLTGYVGDDDGGISLGQLFSKLFSDFSVEPPAE